MPRLDDVARSTSPIQERDNPVKREMISPYRVKRRACEADQQDAEREFQQKTAQALGRSDASVSITACVTTTGAALNPRIRAHMIELGGTRCMTSAIGVR